MKGEPGTPHLSLPSPLGPREVCWALTATAPTPALTEYSSDHQAADMAEIDARLKALQEYMNRLDTRS